MSYEPTNWQTGDIVTAEKLNNLESGVLSASGGGVLVLTQDAETGALDKTWKEIYDAIANGQIQVVPIFLENDEGSGVVSSVIVSAGINENDLYVVFSVDYFWATDSEDGYPINGYEGEGGE